MKRVMIVGPSGAGKSEFSRRLKEILHLPLFHLDNLYWKKDGTHIARNEFDAKLNEVLDLEEWIVDGDYSRTYEARMESCDTIFFLDYPLEVCLAGAEERVGKEREDIPWKEDELDPEFRQQIKDWFPKNRPLLLNLIHQYEKTKTIIVLRNREEGDAWLKAFSES
ncbi:MAG: adenylate kinase [Bacilli bacterium]|nr:adenylate kinase [Bacilli bacterium]